MGPLATTSDVIDALDGTAAVARLTDRSMQAVSNWRERGFFPPFTYPLLTDALRSVGRVAAPHLWRSVPVSALAPRPEALQA